MNKIEILKELLIDELGKVHGGERVGHIADILIENNNGSGLCADIKVLVFLISGVLSDSFKEEHDSDYIGYRNALNDIMKGARHAATAPDAFDALNDFKDQFEITKYKD